jgi:hypothetical protein
MPGNTPTGLLPAGRGVPGVPGTAVVSAEQSVSDAFTTAGLIPGHVDFRNFPYSGFNDTVGGGLMTLTFHWFLPTTGDGRSIMGRGHSLPPAGRRAARPGGRTPRTSGVRRRRSGPRTSSTWPRWPARPSSWASRRS